MKSFSLHACLAILLSITACHVSVTHGFAPVTSPSLTALSSRTAFTNSRTQTTKAATTTTTLLKMVDNEKEEFMKFARQSRSAGSNDRVVELVRPLGIVLADDGQGNVYVQTVAPRGNAARTGMVKEGDIVTMCSATFGNEMWSTRGVGLTRVLAAIRVRAGSTVKLALESPGEGKRKAALTAKQVKEANEARMAAQAKKDRLLSELERDEQKLKGKFFGLF